MESNKALYESSAVQCPTEADLCNLSQELNLKCSTEEIQATQVHFQKVAGAIQNVCRLPDITLPVQYPRTPGYRPSKEDNPYNAWYWKCDIKGAARGPLSGKSVGVKDSIPVAGVPMMCGSLLMEGYTPDFDATVINRVLQAGGHIAGKAVCENLCIDGSSYSSATGPVTNPHDQTRTSGGSSSGCAALVAGGVVDMAIGGDQGGSIRIPASWCGIVGLKPTFGLVPYTGAVSGDPSVDHLGPMTRTVTDCALMLEVLAGYDDGLDPRQTPHTVIPEYTKLLEKGISGKRVGVLKEGFEMVRDFKVSDIVRRAAERLTEAGTTVHQVSVPLHSLGRSMWISSIHQSFFHNMSTSGGVGQFYKGFYPVSLQEAVSRGWQTRPYDISSYMKGVALTSAFLQRSYGNKVYALAQNQALRLRREINDALQKVDVLVMPTQALTAPKLPTAGASCADILEHLSVTSLNTATFNLTGHPALSINAGFIDGLPVGMQIVGRHFDEVAVLQVARSFEKLRDGTQQNR